MTRANRALVVLIVAALGLWGCAQRPAGQVSLERFRALEAKYSKLEDDYRAVATARDQARKKLAESEEQRVQEQDSLTKEREDLKQQLTARTTERDALQTQFESFRKGVRALLNQADTAASTPATSPVISSARAAAPGQS